MEPAIRQVEARLRLATPPGLLTEDCNMSAREWASTLWNKFIGSEKQLDQRRRLQRYYRPRLEQIEERIVPAPVITINPTAISATEQVPTLIDPTMTVT